MDAEVGRQIAAAEIFNDRLIEVLARNDELDDCEFKSKDVNEVLAAVFFAFDELGYKVQHVDG